MGKVRLKENAFFPVELYQESVSAKYGEHFALLVLARSLTSSSPASSLDRAAPSIDRRVCARGGGGMAPCFPLALSFTCVPTRFRMRWDLSVSLSQTSLLTHSAVPVLPTKNSLKYSASKYTLIWRHSTCPILRGFVGQQLRITRVLYYHPRLVVILIRPSR